MHNSYRILEIKLSLILRIFFPKHIHSGTILKQQSSSHCPFTTIFSNQVCNHPLVICSWSSMAHFLPQFYPRLCTASSNYIGRLLDTCTNHKLTTFLQLDKISNLFFGLNGGYQYQMRRLVDSRKGHHQTTHYLAIHRLYIPI